jgi:hypothetical protein
MVNKSFFAAAGGNKNVDAMTNGMATATADVIAESRGVNTSTDDVNTARIGIVT